MAVHPYNLYVDDSGTKEYAPAGDYFIGRGPTRFFVFGGLLVSPAEAGRLSSQAREVKQAYFQTDQVEIKANWLKRPIERKARYLDRFELSEDDLRAFVGEIYGLIRGMSGELVAAIVDKAEVARLYDRPWYAPAIAYECLLQRAQLAMEERFGMLSIIVDDMSGATPKRNQYKDNLFRHHRRLKTAGSRLIRGAPMDRIGELRFSDSKADERLQLADLVAYAVYRQFVDFGGEWDRAESELPLYPYFAELGDKFRKGPDGTFVGYGVVKFPRLSWRRWSARREP